MICSDCKKEQISPVFCQECSNLNLDAKTGDAFDLFNLKRSFKLNRELLEERYLMISKATHPDHARVAPQAQTRLLEISSEVNQGYRDLKDPSMRANILLEAVQKRGGLNLNQSDLPEGFLLAMLELQEEMEEYRSAPGCHEKRLDEIQELMLASVQETQRKLGEYFERLEAMGDSEPEFLAQKIRSQLNTLKYHERVIEETEALLDDCA